MTARLLRYIASPLVSFQPLDGSAFPETWSTGTYWVSLTVCGLVPLGRHAVVISTPPAERGFANRDAGYSALIPVRDHLITIEPSPSGVLYRDRVKVRTRIFTPFVWLFAQLFYLHRQRRWRRLVAHGFEYGPG